MSSFHNKEKHEIQRSKDLLIPSNFEDIDRIAKHPFDRCELLIEIMEISKYLLCFFLDII